MFAQDVFDIEISLAWEGRVNRDRILQVRLDPQLADRLREFTDRLRGSDPNTTESIAVRLLLRQALAARGSEVDFGNAVQNEAFRRAYSEARAVLRKAFKEFFDDRGEA